LFFASTIDHILSKEKDSPGARRTAEQPQLDLESDDVDQNQATVFKCSRIRASISSSPKLPLNKLQNATARREIFLFPMHSYSKEGKSPSSILHRKRDSQKTVTFSKMFATF
jgi:hypothetical protein